MRSSRWIAGVVAVAVGATAGVAAGRRQEPAGAGGSTAPTEGVSGNWELGEFIVDASTTVGSAGGDVVVTEGDLAGLSLTIPDAALPDGTPVTIEHAPIISNTWGDAVDPATPAVRIEIGDGSYADDAMTVSVPVDLAAGRFALGLYVDESGRLEGIPTTPNDSGGVEILTRHFSDWFISLFDPDELPNEIFTGYQVAHDNWQFENFGSYIAPGGICAGMAVTSMWYFVEQHRANEAPSLFNRFDYPHGAATPGFDDDDAHAIRFASMVQKDASWKTEQQVQTDAGLTLSPTMYGWFSELEAGGHDRWQFEAFRYAMYLTGEPQFVGLSRSTGSGGHAIVAYGATIRTLFDDDDDPAAIGDLWVSDPNEPYRLLSIEYDPDLELFGPYSTALEAGAAANEYDAIGYHAVSAIFDWDQIGTRHQELLDGTIGDTKFPAISVFQRVTDPTTQARTWVRATTPTPDANGTVELGFNVAGLSAGRRVWARIYAEDGTTRLARGMSTRTSTGIRFNEVATLTAGTTGQTYKLVVFATVESTASDGTTSTSWEFVDAVPLTVAATPPTTTTTTTTLAPASTTTAAPTPLPTDPPPLYDCTACADGVGGLECRLHCESIGALP